MRKAREDRFGKSTYRKIVPLPAGKRLAPKHVPQLPAGKFADIPGQWALDFDSDDPNALVDPSA
jgi:hypothetical protein